MNDFHDEYDFGPGDQLSPEEIKTFKTMVLVTVIAVTAILITIFVLTR